MLYRFKSQATAEVVMLETNARQLLDIIGKAPGAQGVITVDQMPAALQALSAAMAREATAQHHNHDDHVAEKHDEAAEREHVSLHQRAAPLVDMLKRAGAEGKDITWGV
ncbi:DUF1840 domain-containing protein [Variovorax ginsengisoli]|uniref:DUF1840 domain-containing protein n=1 Tax=Variovorax ginsengisoli TaxID=363844 RepID=A0ABT9SCA5_9BURK|nr:DUF1840 domain-containing protein [Variovorax ginsengisoli]MDP9901965.1 hypothetical protein [Variovorax ginsengisoli]